jgi:putative acetyltransferase
MIEKLYPLAFPDEDLLPLIYELLKEKDTVLSLSAFYKETVIGHCAFTLCKVQKSNQNIALLGPIAVQPEYQRQGVGCSLINAGLDKLREMNINQVYVLGDPAYYSRFGFKSGGGAAPPYVLPEEWTEAWQVLELTEVPADISGKMVVPKYWEDPSLWGA